MTHTSGHYLAGAGALVAPKISARAAVGLAGAAVPGTAVTERGKARLWYYDARLGARGSGATRLAWRVHLGGRDAGDGVIAIDEILKAVGNALDGCGP